MDRMLLPTIGKLLAKIPSIRRKNKGRDDDIFDVEYEEIPKQAMLVETTEEELVLCKL